MSHATIPNYVHAYTLYICYAHWYNNSASSYVVIAGYSHIQNCLVGGISVVMCEVTTSHIILY